MFWFLRIRIRMVFTFTKRNTVNAINLLKNHHDEDTQKYDEDLGRKKKIYLKTKRLSLAL